MLDLSSVNSGTVKSCIGSATAQVAAKWKIYQISLGTDNATHPLADLTKTLYDRAVNAPGGFPIGYPCRKTIIFDH